MAKKILKARRLLSHLSLLFSATFTHLHLFSYAQCKAVICKLIQIQGIQKTCKKNKQYHSKY